MQSFDWYRNRLMSMSAAEIAWRVSNAVRDRMDRVLLPVRQRRATRSLANGAAHQNGNDAHRYRPTASLKFDEFRSEWRDALIVEADQILAHRVRLFGSEPTDLGTVIRWNFEYNKDAATPTGFSGGVDYRDYSESGDCKWVWELSRHHHLVVLARAYAVTENERYAEEVVAQIKSWMAECPFGTGMNWRSPLELGIRLINWVWALDLIENSKANDAFFKVLVSRSASLHLWEIARKYSKYSSANNHLIGEAAGVYIGAAYFNHAPEVSGYRASARRILIEEMAAQIDDDGIHRELAIGYHLFVLQFFLLALHAGEKIGEPFPREYTDRLAKMADVLADYYAAGSDGVSFGDADDGYVLDIGGVRGDYTPWVDATWLLLDRGSLSSGSTEAAFWLTGKVSAAAGSNESIAEKPKLESKYYAGAGICLLQGIHAETGSPVAVTMDCGPLGFKSIAAHGHADALSITVRFNGAPFLIDPGTYDYFSFDEWRNYFRSTRAHNTVEVDGLDQSEMLGKFLWGHRANAKCIEWNTDSKTTRAVGEHDGYMRLPDPVLHRRTVELTHSSGVLCIKDGIVANERHEIVMRFHCAPECAVERVDNRTLCIVREEGCLELTLPADGEVTIAKGETRPIIGWASRAYHQKQATTTITARYDCNGSTDYETHMQLYGPMENR